MHLAWNFFDDFEGYDPAAAQPAPSPSPSYDDAEDDGADSD